MKKRVKSRDTPQKRLRHKVSQSTKRVTKGDQTRLKHAPGTRRGDRPNDADNEKDNDQGKGDEEDEDTDEEEEEEEEEEEMKFNIPYLSSQDIEPGNFL